jgi:hypothetical protein
MDAAQIVASSMTVSDKIRALDRLNYPRAEIARLLGKRYQHVRNVLEADHVANRNHGASTPGVGEGSATYRSDHALVQPDATRSPAYRMPIGPDGAIVLPADVLARLHQRPGSVAIGEMVGDCLLIISVEESIRRLQALGDTLDPTVSLVDKLIAERRAEAKREWGD